MSGLISNELALLRLGFANVSRDNDELRAERDQLAEQVKLRDAAIHAADQVTNAEISKLRVERDGANERAGLLLKAKDEWAERARAAEAELDQARRTAEHWKAEHLAGNAVIDQLRAQVDALRHLAGELYQVLGALDAPAGVLDAVLAAARCGPMEGRGSLLPFVSDEHETLRKDAERYRLLRRVTIEVHDGSDAEFDAEFDFAIDAALAAKEGA